MSRIQQIFFLPPMATARLGGSDIPLDSFTWVEDPTLHGAGLTVIAPTTSLEVLQDGSVRPFLPTSIQFRDGTFLRPVAPFFELWAQLEGETDIKALTTALLEECGGSVDGVTFTVTASNHKAARRTGDPACAFTARIEVLGNDYNPHPLLASSLGDQPLVFPQQPIPLGQFQVIRPVTAQALNLDLSVLRVRFTPAKGEVYGPPNATSAEEPEFPNLNRRYELVRPANRILNPVSSWLNYTGDDTAYNNPEPGDTYDGADDDSRNNQSYGVVDDTCDALVEAIVIASGDRLRATARVFCGPPDFAPDRRPFVSLADELIDRDPPAPEQVEGTLEALDRLADLFQRVYETASLANVDALRDRAIGGGQDGGTPRDRPRTNDDSMTPRDKPYYRPDQPDIGEPTPAQRLPYAATARDKHLQHAEAEDLASFLRDQAELVRRLIRPPYGPFKDLRTDPAPGAKPDPRHRDPRITRDTLHDMRMPPYMRDSDATALSLTRRQYDSVMQMVDRFAPKGRKKALAEPLQTRAHAHMAQVVERRKGKKP
jgi:hypothetical protein